MTRKGESVTLALSSEDKAALEAIALKFGCTWGDKPNVSALMKAIAQRSLEVNWPNGEAPEDTRARSLELAIDAIKSGLDRLKDIL